VKFLVDNQLSAAVARWLAAKEYDAVYVLDRDPGRAKDSELWQICCGERRIMVTRDEDFFFLAGHPGATGRLLWIRIGNCRKQMLLDALERSWSSIANAFLSGQQIVELR
jgi:predicted nuclease of predicted toxin-antitoxin system